MRRSFFDTNVLLYLYDDNEPEKKARALELFEGEVEADRAVVSTQVLQEFYVNATRKLRQPLSPERAEARVRDFSTLPLVRVDAPLILAAIARSRALQFSFWDALIFPRMRQAPTASSPKTSSTDNLPRVSGSKTLSSDPSGDHDHGRPVAPHTTTVFTAALRVGSNIGPWLRRKRTVGG